VPVGSKEYHQWELGFSFETSTSGPDKMFFRIVLLRSEADLERDTHLTQHKVRKSLGRSFSGLEAFYPVRAGSRTGNRRLLDRILQETPQSSKPVSPPDLLAFLVGSPAITDTDFVNSKPKFGHLDGNLRFESEAVFLDRY
jgi:hypothetical protein